MHSLLNINRRFRNSCCSCNIWLNIWHFILSTTNNFIPRLWLRFDIRMLLLMLLFHWRGALHLLIVSNIVVVVESWRRSGDNLVGGIRTKKNNRKLSFVNFNNFVLMRTRRSTHRMSRKRRLVCLKRQDILVDLFQTRRRSNYRL
uniref:Candidate secreted effector n=1 Tax=Meloidogyne incognita TaxID=6306 RepID=A0A914LFT4_MELIC